MNVAEQVIKEYVNQLEKKFGGDTKYKKYLAEMNKIKLKVITEDDVRRVIQPFLYDWGGMDRVLGKKEFRNWQTNIVRPIKSSSEKLEDFKKRNLGDVKLGELEPGIKCCYESLCKVIGGIAAAKVLHLICPSFFPLWDNPIANAIRNEDVQVVELYPTDYGRQRYGSTIDDFAKFLERKGERKLKKWSHEYYRFMQATQNFIKRYEAILSELATKYQKGILRISDECFWWAATHRPLYLFFEGDCG